MNVTNAARRSPKPNRRQQQAAAARHSLAYRQRQREKGLPTGSDIDAMIAFVLVRLACRERGLKTDATQIPKLCEVVANQFSVAAEARDALADRVASRVDRMRTGG